ncbi:2-hydroxyacid dehydrogenase [Lapillicoccus jejuensis]|uniref:Phosphoglycerate dehydrogenase-like enzyme n=1 Tax=Lapillicoccus jejuensis TaxID=402171 RepID=A0A542E306_9MICO|nr:2-hydroxyacid dehydrogenase [Lapillicoccus jejuensis]TQJ09713.1 phosphoglycerate dehydrogenase-like enzyme [Lapillicoccus jejuensis]
MASDTTRPLVTVPDEQWVELIQRSGPLDGVELAAWDLHEPHPRADEIRVVVPPYLDKQQRPELLAELPHLEVVQLLTAGYDNVATHIPAGVRLANAAGVHDASTAELALTLTLAALRGIPTFVRAQDRGEWQRTQQWPALADKRVLVVGYGNVGRAVVRRLLPFEVEVTAVASKARAGDDLVSEVHGIAELPALLPHHEVVVLIVPLTDDTTGLVDEAFLAAMPDGALLVNVARGKVVDTDALVAALTTGRITAALDVTDPEPLPEDHPLWSAPGVLISPHVGGASTAFLPRALRMVRSQLTSYAATGEVEHVVLTGR